MDTTKFIETLSLCKTAYFLAQEEYGLNKFNKREFEGALPKRKSLRKTILRVKQIAQHAGSLSHHEERMIAAAYDQGLLTRHRQEDKEIT